MPPTRFHYLGSIQVAGPGHLEILLETDQIPIGAVGLPRMAGPSTRSYATAKEILAGLGLAIPKLLVRFAGKLLTPQRESTPTPARITILGKCGSITVHNIVYDIHPAVESTREKSYVHLLARDPSDVERQRAPE